MLETILGANALIGREGGRWPVKLDRNDLSHGCVIYHVGLNTTLVQGMDSSSTNRHVLLRQSHNILHTQTTYDQSFWKCLHFICIKDLLRKPSVTCHPEDVLSQRNSKCFGQNLNPIKHFNHIFIGAAFLMHAVTENLTNFLDGLPSTR